MERMNALPPGGVQEAPPIKNVNTDKQPARIAGMFDAIAPSYDRLNHVLSGGIDWWWRRRAVKSLELTGRERVLDLCTGTGDLAMATAAAARDVIGVDFAGAMLSVGAAKVRRAGLAGRVRFARGDAQRVPLADASVDAVTIAFGIRNVQDTERACRECWRVLKPGGRLAILEFGKVTMPGVRGVYEWYLRHVLPRIGRAVSRHREAYDYLPASMAEFPSGDEFVKILVRAGFSDARAVRLSVGAVYLYVARRA